jgi:hypothetical protein
MDPEGVKVFSCGICGEDIFLKIFFGEIFLEKISSAFSL